MLIPGGRIGKIRRSSALMADVVEKIGKEDGGLTDEGELESMQAGITSGLSVASTGVSLESLLVSVARPSAPSSSQHGDLSSSPTYRHHRHTSPVSRMMPDVRRLIFDVWCLMITMIMCMMYDQ